MVEEVKMATDPRLLQFQDSNSLNLSVTPGSVEKQGERIGGEYRVGTGPLYVGKSSQESLFESLSMIAGGVVGTTQNLVQYQAAVDEGKRQKFLAEWESPDGPAAKISNDPNLSDEEKVNKTQEWLESNVPNQNSNRVFGARVMKDWFDKNPLANDLFDQKFADFQQEAATLSPDQRLELYDERFKYYISSELPSAVNARVTLLGQSAKHITDLNTVTDNLVIESQSNSFLTVAQAVLASKTGNQQALALLREAAKDPASKQELENQIEVAERYIETPTVDYLDAALFSGVTGSGPKIPGSIQDPYFEERNEKARAAALRLHGQLMPKIVLEKAAWESSTQEQQMQKIALQGLPASPTAAVKEVISPMLVTSANNQTPETQAKVVGSLLKSVTATAKKNNWSEEETSTYFLDVVKEAWKNGSPTIRQWLASSGLLGIEEAELSSLSGVFETNAYPSEFEEKTKEHLRYSLNENNEFTQHLNKQAVLNASGSEALPQTIVSPNQLPVFGSYFKKLISTNNPNAFTAKSGSYNQQVVAGFDDLGLGQELLNEGTGPIVWASLGLPSQDYRLWLAVQRNEDIDPEVAASIESRYGRIRDIDSAIAYVQEKNADPKWATMNAAAKKELQKIYSWAKSAADSGSGLGLPGYFSTEGAAKTILGVVSTNPDAQNQSVFDFATKTTEGNQLSLKISQIGEALVYDRPKNSGLLFEIPTGQTINGETIPFPEEVMSQVTSYLVKRQEELQVGLREGNINFIQYKAALSRLEKQAKRYAVGVLLDEEIARNPEVYLGSKPEKQQAQLDLYKKWKESFLNLNEEFYYWTSNTDNSDLFWKDTSFLSLYSADNNLDNISFNVTEAGLEDPEELKKWYRLSFSFSRGLFNEENVRTTLKKHFEVLSIARDNGATVPDMLKTEDGKQAYYVLMAYMSGVNQRARTQVLKNGDAFDVASFNIARNTIIQRELSGGAENYIPAARWLSGYNLLTNSPDAKTGAYKVMNPSGAYLNISNDQLASYQAEEDDYNKTVSNMMRFMFSGAVSLLNPKASTGLPGVNGMPPSTSKLLDPLVGFGTPLDARARAEEGQEWDYNTRRDNILARVEKVYYVPGSSPQQKFDNLLSMLAIATGNYGTGENQLLPYDANTRQFLMTEFGGRAEDTLWDSSRPGMVDDITALQSAGAGDPLLQFEILAAQLSATGGLNDFLSGVEYNLNDYNRGGKVDLQKVLDGFNAVGFILNQERGIPLVDYRQAVETGGINEMVSGNVGVRIFQPNAENKERVFRTIQAFGLVPPAIFDSTGREEVIKEGMIWDDTIVLPSVSGKESVGILTYFFVPQKEKWEVETLTTFVESELASAGIDTTSPKSRQDIASVVTSIQDRQRLSSDPIYKTNAYVLHTISQQIPNYRLPSWLYDNNQAIMASSRRAHFQLDDNGTISQFAAIGTDPINENSSRRSLNIKLRPEFFPIKSFEDRSYLTEQFDWIKSLKEKDENLWGRIKYSYGFLTGGEE